MKAQSLLAGAVLAYSITSIAVVSLLVRKRLMVAIGYMIIIAGAALAAYYG